MVVYKWLKTMENNETVGSKVAVVAHKGWSTSRLQQVVIIYRDLTVKSFSSVLPDFN